MGFIKGVGYVIVATLVVMLLGAVGTVVSIIASASGVILSAVAAIAFVAYCIRDYFETKKTDPAAGDQEKKSETT